MLLTNNCITLLPILVYYITNYLLPKNEFISGKLAKSWLSWQDLAKFLLHLGNHGSHGKILIKVLLRYPWRVDPGENNIFVSHQKN